MTTTTPINALPSPDDSSPNDPPIHFVALADQLDTRLVPRFATTTARDNAITAPVDGMAASVTGLGTFVYLGGWKLLPLGQVAAVKQTNVQSFSSATETRVTGATNITVTLYAGRAYRARWSTICISDTADAQITIKLRGRSGSGVTVQTTDTTIGYGSRTLHNTGGVGEETLDFSDYFTVGSSGAYTISAFGSRPSASGTVSIRDNTSLAIDDVGGPAGLSGFAQLS